MKSRNIMIWCSAAGCFYLHFLFLSTTSFAQISFERTYGGASSEIGYSVHQTQDGGYIVGGKTKSFGEGEDDVYLVKTDSLGDTLWTKTWGGTDNDRAYSIDETQDGGYIMTGSTRSFGSGNWDVYVVRTNQTGDTLWTRTFGSTDWDWGYFIEETSDGGYILTGYTTPIDSGDADVFLVRMDIFGNTLWTKTYGDTLDDVGFAVRETRDGGYIITGVWSYTLGLEEIYLIKTDSMGDTLWTKKHGGPNSDFGYSVQETQDGGYIIGGETISFGSGSYDIYLLKTDSLGNFLWQKTYGGSAADAGHFVQETQDGGFILTGSFRAGLSDLYVIRTNSSGDSLWTRIYGGSGSDIGYYVQETSDNGYIISGYTDSFGAGLPDVYLIKIEGTVGVEEESNDEYRTRNIEFRLNQNQPNPFNKLTVISYQIPHTPFAKGGFKGDLPFNKGGQRGIHVRLAIYDITGRLVETLVDEHQTPGVYQIHWNGRTGVSPVRSGIYFYQLKTENFTATRKLILLK
jgi:hypothetical protein